jgi:isopentenyl diphosphate isomerase/L-lactate dehydrogenase-like FMN-dependent dehydrogenase
MRGTDVVKALALGARAVGIGRLQCIGLAAGGEAALVRMLEILKTEIRTCMGLLGASEVSELGPTFLEKAAPLAQNWLDSAFPLLNEGYGRQQDISELSMALPDSAMARG